ncbi:MAG: ribonuclease E/G [Rhodospirillaceae bacterium]|nr:ribonuclease E/G [Rhodospirillaceae bacterium]
MLAVYCSVMTPRHWAAFLDHGKLVGYSVEPTGTVARFGDVHAAVLRHINKATGFATVMLAGDESALLDLPRDRRLPTIGARLLVQVRRGGRGSKMAKVSDRIRLQDGTSGVDIFWVDGVGRTEPDLAGPADVSGADERTLLAARVGALIAAADAAAAPKLLLRQHDCLTDLLMRFPEAASSTMRCDSRTMAERWSERSSSGPVASPIQVDFEPERDWRFRRTDIVDALRDALEPEQHLTGGGALLVEPGETLTAIDINAGARMHSSGEERLAYQINEAAVPEIVRLIRLLNLSGNIVIDFMGMRASGRRRTIAGNLQAAMAIDPAEPWVGGMSPLGLVEIGRRHLGPDLYDAFSIDRARARGLEVEGLDALTGGL